ncbi:MAG: hypothetical protein CMM58_01005 [Rhodospirillaceae bacterium]|nr:hypothetical protein [Rhodospirillaceae bacterium]|tara:strand:+ start:1742 stop:2080 length:339 start_codon:yes stop_codon:yes gene_type:complete
MAKLINLKQTKHSGNSLYFSKAELNKILSTYSDGVIKDYWRDYAIDQNGMISVFSIFKNSHERPSFYVIKKNRAGSQTSSFVLQYRQKVIETSHLLDPILKRLKMIPKLVKK